MASRIMTLRQFYSSPLGRKVKQRLRALTMDMWRNEASDVIVGFGYATPLLRVLERLGGKPQILVALMPLAQGALYWPVHADNRSILADTLTPPFAPSTVHRALLLHAIEHEACPQELLSVIWELLVPGGKLLLIVPNRNGLWARRGMTPFATGTPYRMADMRRMLEETKFTLRRGSTALFAPPSHHPLWIRLFTILEWVSAWCFPSAGGVLVLEAEKQIYAGIGERQAATKPQRWATQSTPIVTQRSKI